MLIIRRALAGLHLLVGIGAIAGGLAAILDPAAPLGMVASDMPNFPFDSFLVPGIILFTVIGLGNLAAAVPVFLGKKWLGYPSGTAGIALMVWIMVQCAMLGSIVALHVIFFCLGAVIGCLALIQLAVEGLWPGTWAQRLVAMLRDKRPGTG